MNIAFLNLQHNKDWGGGEKWTIVSAKGLAEKGHNLTVFGRYNSFMVERAHKLGLGAVPAPAGSDYAPATIWTMAAELKKRKIDVLVAHHNKDARTGGVAAKMLGIPVVFRNGFPIIHDNIRHRLTAKFWDRILTCSQRICDFYEKNRWFGSDVIDVIPNGIEIPEDDSKWTHLRKEWFDEDDILLAVFSGRLTSVKRPLDLLKIWRGLGANSKWRLMFIGTGHLHEELKERVKEPEFSNRVKVIGFKENAHKLITAADLAVLPSTEEAMPNTLMESMVQGVAAASTPVGDIPYLFNQGKAGWILPVGDVDAWVKFLKRLEQNPKEIVEMAEAGKKWIREEFTYDKMIGRIEDSLKRAMEGRPGATHSGTR